MKQGMRFIARPDQFFNQLQWSTHHWYIMFTFMVVSAIEARVGQQKELVRIFAHALTQHFHMPFDIALWLVVAVKLGLVLLGATIAANLIWFVGSFFGEQNSRRVLFRRMAVVFTVLLGGYTAVQLELSYPALGTLALFLFLWGAILGYFAIREQFNLNSSEAFLMTLIAALILLGGWRGSNIAMEKVAESHLSEVAKVSGRLPVRY